MKRTFLKRLCALALALVLAVPAAVMTAGAADITLEGLESTLSLTMGQSVTKTVTVKPDNLTDIKVTWKVREQDKSVLEVRDDSGDGRTVTLVPSAIGTAILTVTAEGKLSGLSVSTGEMTCKVTVAGSEVTGLVLEYEKMNLDVDQVGRITAYPTPTTVAGSQIRWEVLESDQDKQEKDAPAIAVIEDPPEGQQMTITPKRPGIVTLQATAGTKTAQCEVTVKGVRLSKESMTLKVGDLDNTLTAKPIGNIGSLVSWESGNQKVAFVDPTTGAIQAQSVGTTQITAHIGSYAASCELTVVDNKANDIETSAEAGQPMSMSGLYDKLKVCCEEALDKSTLTYVSNLTVSPKQGVLYYNYISSDSHGSGVGNERYYLDAVSGRRRLSDVTFVPNLDFSGVATISYYGYNENDRFFVGTISVKVGQTDDVAYTTTGTNPANFKAADFNNICRERNGRDLRYVTFDPPAARYGTLYYNYSANGTYTALVNSTTQYTRASSSYQLGGVSFVADKDYTGTVRIGYRAVDTAGQSFTGRVTITVNAADNRENGDVSYTSNQRQRVSLRAADFQDACREITGVNLNYIRFTRLPSTSDGVLYYNYKSNGSYGSKVSTGTRYYRTGTPSINSITFVPGDNASGTVVIPYTGYDQEGDALSGNLRIRISGVGGSEDVKYRAQSGRALQFEAADFNEACIRANNARLSYVRFELPSTSEGTLYYNYRSSSSPGTKISSTQSCYYSGGSYKLDNVYFVPKSNYTGTVEIDFHGQDVDGSSFDGIVEIIVDDEGDASLRYSTSGGSAAAFRASDFNSACYAITGDALDYVRFTLPASSRGTLYYQRKSRGVGTRVSSSTSYYRSGSRNLLDDVSFEAALNYTGTVAIDFTGWSTGGDRFEGTVEIDVTAPTASTIQYSGSSLPITLQSRDFSNASDVMLGRELSYIRFNSLPTASQGKLLLGYSGPMAAAAEVTSGTSYYLSKAPQLSQISFVAKPGFQGKLSIPFTGTDTAGKTFTGTVEITISNLLSGSSFNDMGNAAWARPSVEFLYHYGVVSGIGQGRFGPTQQIRRGDFVLMLCKAFQLRGSGSLASFADVPHNSYYAQAIATAKELGIVRGTGNSRFLPNSSLTRQDAMVMIQRAMEATGKGVATGNGSLSGFPDQAQVADYARSACAALAAAGVIKGDGAGRLLPRAAISRAEMAVILHRVLTL